MNIAIFGKSFSEDGFVYMQQLVKKLEDVGSNLFIYEPFYKFIKDKIRFDLKFSIFNFSKEIKGKIDFLFSVGGDGTLLDTITLVQDSNIPILGINMGRLGFLSSISKEEIIPAIDEIIRGEYILDKRSLLRLETSNNLFGSLNYALNDLTVSKKGSPSLIHIRVFINDDLLNSYWADGLIVATPTGSTAYSLGCGGPILIPGSENFVITPISSHNLTVRPVVIPDNSIIKIRVNGRSESFYVSLDSRVKAIDSSIELIIRKENFNISIIRMKNKNFFKTIREKLMWGLDIRN